MAMVEMYETQPEPETISLGHVDIIFKGQSFEDVDEEFATLISMEFAAIVNERLQSVITTTTGFSTSGYEVSLETLTLEFDSVFEGSIVGRFKMIGAAMITSYGMVASYPAFKEAVPVLTNDIGLVIQYVIDRSPKPPPHTPSPKEFQLYFRNEEEVLSEILEKKGI